MNLPGDQTWERVEKLAEEVGNLAPDEVRRRLSDLATGGESPTVLTLLGSWLSLPPPASDLHVGMLLGGRYLLRAKIGEGGMGSVWRASQELIERDVAVKTIHPSIVTPALHAKFIGEMKILGQLNHPGIVRIFDAGMHQTPDARPIPFFAMELVEGMPLDRWAAPLRDDKIALLQTVSEVCAALGGAHERQIVHRDLKPSNILVRSNGQPVILDFGIARLRGLVLEDEEGVFSGTPQYAAPEQHLGRDNDFRSGESVDIYAMGVLLFEVLAGRRLFEFSRGTSITEMRRVVLDSEVLRLSHVVPDCPAALEEIVSRAIRRDPADRFYSIAALGRALDRVATQIAEPKPPPPRWQPAPGAIIPRTSWVLTEKIGEGGAGQVWLGAHKQLGERRVFKFCDTEEKARTLKREVTLFRLLKERVGRNPHFITLHEVSLDEPPYYLMMDYVDARNLETWCAAQPGGLPAIPEATRLEIIIQAAEALQAAHEAGILHRDIKPDNLLVGNPGSGLHIFVADFGIGQIVTGQILRDTTRLGFTRTVFNLKTDRLSGTLLYLAPEVLEGAPATARSDIYSLGVILWQLLAGNLHAALDPSDWPSRIEDPILCEMLRRALAGDPEKRWASAGELAGSLRSLPERRIADQRRRAENKARERAAYHRGLLRATAFATAALCVVAGLAWYGFHESKVARLAQIGARAGEVSAIRSSQNAGKRWEAWSLIKANASNCPVDLREKFRNEAIAVLALPDFSLMPESIPEVAETSRAVASKNLHSFASVTKAGEIRILRRDSSEHWVAMQTNPPALSGVESLQISDEGAAASAVLADGEGRVWHGQQWQVIRGPFAPGKLMICDGGLAAIARPDGSIDLMRAEQDFLRPAGTLGQDRARTLDAPPSTKPRPFPPARPASSLSFSPDRKHLASGSSYSLFVLIWDTETAQLLAAGAHKHAVTGIAWNPDSPKQLASGAEDGVVIIWDLEHREGGAVSEKGIFLRPMIECLPPSSKKVLVRDLTYGFEGRVLFVLYDDSELAAFDVESGRLLDLIKTAPQTTKINFGKHHLALIHPDGSFGFRSFAWPGVFQEAKVFQGSLMAVDADDTGTLFLARAHEGTAILEPFSLRILLRLNQAYGNAARFNPETGALIAIGGGQMRYYERVVSAVLPQRIAFKRPPTTGDSEFGDLDMILRKKGERIGAIAAGAMLTVRVSGRDGSQLKMFESGSIRKVRLHPSGAWVVAISNEASHPAYSRVEPQSVPQAMNLPAEHYLDISFSPNGQFIALRSLEKLRIVATQDWTEIASLDLPSRIQTDAPVAFSPDSRALLAVGPDAVPILFHVPEKPESDRAWSPIARLTSPVVRDIIAARFGGPGNAFLILGTADGYFQTWNLAELRGALRQVGLDWDTPRLVTPSSFPVIERVELE